MTADPTPERPLLVFDGDCGFCTSVARWWQRRSGLDRVEPWQLLDLDAVGLAAEDCERAVQWIGTDGKVAAAEDAVVAALCHAGGAWGVVGRVMGLPGVRHAAGLVYRLVARYRHRMPGGTPACKVG